MPVITKDQAAENFFNARDTYTKAATEKAYWANQEENARNAKNYAAAQISSSRSEKINFEKRLQGIRDIIKMLEGGGFFSTDVPATIRDANTTLTSTNDSYHKCIRLSEGGAADMENVFQAQSVPDDQNSGRALEEFKAAARELDAAIKDLERRIANLEGQMGELTKKINACSAEQASLRKTMWSSSYDMLRYRSAMF